MEYKLFDTDTFNTEKARNAQEEYCKKHRVPMLNKCKEHNPYTNISVEYAASLHITKCPICGSILN